jgi:hypothetical protein
LKYAGCPLLVGLSLISNNMRYTHRSRYQRDLVSSNKGVGNFLEASEHKKADLIKACGPTDTVHRECHSMKRPNLSIMVATGILIKSGKKLKEFGSN